MTEYIVPYQDAESEFTEKQLPLHHPPLQGGDGGGGPGPHRGNEKEIL